VFRKPSTSARTFNLKSHSFLPGRPGCEYLGFDFASFLPYRLKHLSVISNSPVSFILQRFQWNFYILIISISTCTSVATSISAISSFDMSQGKGEIKSKDLCFQLNKRDLHDHHRHHIWLHLFNKLFLCKCVDPFPPFR
jgi:hypothetical protein